MLLDKDGTDNLLDLRSGAKCRLFEFRWPIVSFRWSIYHNVSGYQW